ncbi:MAG: oxygen-independent coproporphyrinogen III oxidase [Rubrivivax sp.]|nr:MAG: oxygen-independent coproporphyrinogen III oxidase [Rubrivivax sp.]
MTASAPSATATADPSDWAETRRALLSGFDVSGPRYTSYPTADRFVEAFGSPQWQQALAQRASGAGLHGGATAPWSVYVHIPFCESVCYYCACHKVVTKRHDRASAYLASLEAEIALVADRLGRGHLVSQLHLGGGTPTFLSDDELARLLAALRGVFRFSEPGEFAIEVDPRTVDAARLHRLAALGFNRLSLGIQDFDPAVQQAVHRVQPYASVAELMGSARAAGFRSINMDLIYGLPNQTPASFARTLCQVEGLRPERVAVYAYAHLPQRFKPQRRIDARLLPPPPDKIAMLSLAIDHLQDAGYDYIGMDHFALPDDPLAVARRQGRLHRNFQGYSTQAESDLIGLGVSAISKVGPHYSQNLKAIEDYGDALARGELPVARGLSLSRDDLLRRAVIMAIMCQGRVDYESIELAHLIDFRRYFAAELNQLQSMADQALLTLEPDGLCVTTLGWYVVRAIAMVFDRHLQADRAATQFSRIL